MTCRDGITHDLLVMQQVFPPSLFAAVLAGSHSARAKTTSSLEQGGGQHAYLTGLQNNAGELAKAGAKLEYCVHLHVHVLQKRGITFLLGPNGNPGSSATPFRASSHPWSSEDSGLKALRLLRFLLLVQARSALDGPGAASGRRLQSTPDMSPCRRPALRCGPPGRVGAVVSTSGGLEKARERRCCVDPDGATAAVLCRPAGAAVA